MSPSEFIKWVVVLVLTAVFVLPIIGGVLYGAVVGIGLIIEWFDIRKDMRDDSRS